MYALHVGGDGEEAGRGRVELVEDGREGEEVGCCLAVFFGCTSGVLEGTGDADGNLEAGD